MSETIRAPFPYYGGKSRAASLIWERFGDTQNYVEPFAGSLAVLLGRPFPSRIETVNDKDAFLCNFWRAIQPHAAPDEVVYWCDSPVNECDQNAIHIWLVNQREAFTARLMGDPDYYDAKIAGRWVYGICCWIGRGWCSGNGSWQNVDGQFVHQKASGQGVSRQIVHLGDAGQGIHSKTMHFRENDGQDREKLPTLFAALSQRLRNVRVCCGDWTRVLGPSVLYQRGMSGMTGILFDPPYSTDEHRDEGLYAVEDMQVAHAVRAWCLEHGTQPRLRIALCGYEDMHDVFLAKGWSKAHWVAKGGFGGQRKGPDKNLNKFRETLWFSPACLGPQQPTLFDEHGDHTRGQR